MEASKIHLRPMATENWETLLQWFDQEGGVPFLDETVRMAMQYVNCKTIAAVDEKETLKGILIWMENRPDYAYIACYVVAAGSRGHGIGPVMWEKMIEQLGPEKNLGLDSLPLMTQNYKEKSGFGVPGFEAIRLGGMVEDFLPRLPVDEGIAASLQVESYAPRHYAAVRDFDKGVIGWDREDFLRLWLTQPFVATVCGFKDGDLVGFACVCPTRNGLRVGPLYAENLGTALILVKRVLGNYPRSKNELVIFSTPSSNHSFIQTLTDSGLETLQVSYRIYTKRAQVLPGQAKLFCMTANFCQAD